MRPRRRDDLGVGDRIVRRIADHAADSRALSRRDRGEQSHRRKETNDESHRLKLSLGPPPGHANLSRQFAAPYACSRFVSGPAVAAQSAVSSNPTSPDPSRPMSIREDLELLDQAQHDLELMADEFEDSSDGGIDRRDFVFWSLVTAAASTFGFGARALAQGATT